MVPPDWRFVASRPAHFVALGFGAGLSPFAPGTVGTLIGYPLFVLLHALFPTIAGLVVLGILFALGCHWCEVTGRAIGVADYRGIVWDEIVAMAAILFFVPTTVVAWIAACFAFRLFDIWKPWPICIVDARLKNGLGVMLDDALAAIPAIIVVRVGAEIVPK
ncbi:phosphatidylglycerophosphatase A [Accumulibacter sp.]|uniref:phosphatidylglycerophosphatase A family protein n=1 Tax=Accumulibacter sp. TaxID=2053492 RepID=UPI00338DDC69